MRAAAFSLSHGEATRPCWTGHSVGHLPASWRKGGGESSDVHQTEKLLDRSLLIDVARLQAKYTPAAANWSLWRRTQALF
ncbi:hypothetical protein CHR56_01260 [Rhizobium leguminosarum bv. viciae]|nr:hypothetical protein CHR56_01260 [Rhizobium leguminosarum bv. viciae]